MKLDLLKSKLFKKKFSLFFILISLNPFNLTTKFFFCKRCIVSNLQRSIDFTFLDNNIIEPKIKSEIKSKMFLLGTNKIKKQ